MFRNFLVKMVPIKKWHEFKKEYNLHESSYFKWLQLEDSRKMEIYSQRKL